MLTADNIVQTAEGSSGSTTTDTFDAVFATPTLESSGVILFITNAPSEDPDDTGWTLMNNGATDFLRSMVWGRESTGGETTWTINYSAPVVLIWHMVEIKDIESFEANPNNFGYPYTYDTAIDRSAAAINNTICNTGNSGQNNQSGDEIIFSFGTVLKFSGGTPPAFTSIADVTAGQPGTWAQLGSEAVTTHATESNIRSRSYCKFTDDQQSRIDARWTWNAVTDQLCADIHGVMASWDQRVRDRVDRYSGYRR